MSTRNSPPPPAPLRSEMGYRDRNIAETSLSPCFVLSMNLANMLTHFVLGAVAFSAIGVANYYAATTSLKQHIYLCVTGYVILMSQAILVISPHTTWTQSLKFRHKKIVHAVIQIVGSSIAITGSVIRIINIESHFATTHGILGIVAMMLTCLSLIGGILNFLSVNFKINVFFIKILHSSFGCTTLAVSFVSLIFGFDKTLYRDVYGHVNADLVISLTVIALLGTILAACISGFNKMIGR